MYCNSKSAMQYSEYAAQKFLKTKMQWKMTSISPCNESCETDHVFGTFDWYEQIECC